MRKHIIAVAILSALTLPAFAEQFPVPEGWQVSQRIELKDGTFLNIYKDGKYAMESRFGHPLDMKPGQTMVTKDGRSFTMASNETYRVSFANPLLSPRY